MMLPGFYTKYQILDTRYRKSAGFTLIELLMVIAIIGILVTMATYSYNNAQVKARDAKRKSNITEIKNALSLYREDTDGYPGQLSGLEPNYITLPKDPTSSSNYIYSPSGNRSVIYQGSTITVYDYYTLTACLENPNDPKKDGSKNAACSIASFTITNPN